MDPTGRLAKTPLHALHVALGARMVPFAGYEMPVQYTGGILREHLHTRAAASLFDVSHMGQVELRGPGVREALEALVPVDVLGLAPGRQRYALFTTAAGGILDDLMVANLGDRLLLVVNAGRKAADLAHLADHLRGMVQPRPDRALLALQGPGAEAALLPLAPGLAGTRFMDVRETEVAGVPAIVSRSGYTGEDGFELSVPAEAAEALARTLLARPGVAPAGLGARDSLRLEAGLPLHGHDIDETTTPAEAGLGWAIQKVRRRGGARAGGFPGAARILAELEAGPARRRVGLLPEGRAPVREGAPLFAAAAGGAAVGAVTSGGWGATLGAPLAMGLVPVALAEPGTILHAELRGRRLPVAVAALPFVPPRFKRT